MAASSTLVPINASAASVTSNAVAATAPRPTLARIQFPFESSVRLTPTPTTAPTPALTPTHLNFSGPQRTSNTRKRCTSVRPRTPANLCGRGETNSKSAGSGFDSRCKSFLIFASSVFRAFSFLITSYYFLHFFFISFSSILS